MTTVRRARKAVTDFAKLMEERLRANDGKDGWADCDSDWLLERTFEEWLELRDALESSGRCADRRLPVLRRQVREECADVANFAMMIADNLKET